MRRIPVLALGGIFATLFLLSSILSSSAQPNAVANAVIDFEGLEAGATPSILSSGNGISGDPIIGFVMMDGDNPVFGHDFNAAMVFDATCPPTNTPASCSGNDGDLFKPQLGKVLIITEDMDSSDPDDADVEGSFFEFDFSNWGPGVVTVDSFNILDVEDDEGSARIELYSGGESGTLLATVPIPPTGNNGLDTIDVNVSGVDFIQITLNGSGAIDNLRISVEQEVPPTDTATPTPTETPIVTVTPSPTPTNTPTPTPTEPTAIDLLYFNVGVNGQKVQLTWATIAEIDNYGFKLYRSATEDFDDAEEIAFIPANGGVGKFTEYEYADAPGTGDWFYWLADVDTKGVVTVHSPDQPLKASIQAVQFYHRMFIPLVAGR